MSLFYFTFWRIDGPTWQMDSGGGGPLRAHEVPTWSTNVKREPMSQCECHLGNPDSRGTPEVGSLPTRHRPRAGPFAQHP